MQLIGQNIDHDLMRDYVKNEMLKGSENSMKKLLVQLDQRNADEFISKCSIKPNTEMIYKMIFVS